MNNMKIFVVSDTHGHIDGFLNKIKNMDEPDLIIHLGDYVEDGLKIEEKLGIETIIVKGNGDYYQKEYKYDEVLNLGNKVFFITHGHRYSVRYGINNLFYRTKELGADIVLFGHTHVPVLMKESGIIIMNPGSPYQPRGLDGKKTFGIIEINHDIVGSIVEIN